MISIVRHLRLIQGPLHSCCLLVRTPNIPSAASKGKQAPAYWCSTSKKPNDPIVPKQSTSTNSSGLQTTPEKTVVLSAEAQRAVWAWKIISMIRDAHPPTSFEDSLRSRLLAAKIDTADLEFDLSD
jgi:hypothetical protein